MKKPVLIIITGLPGTGKTTIARKIANAFNLPLIIRDDIKETIFDAVGWSDREWSKKVGLSSYKLLYYFLDEIMKTGKSLIVETNFATERDSASLQERVVKYNYDPLQIVCQCEGEVLYERFKNRSESEERHPGHGDHLNYAEFKETLLKPYAPLAVVGEEIIFNTTDLKKLDYETVLKRIEEFL